MCSYWLRTWRPIKKTPYVIFYCLSFKIILCMLILCDPSKQNKNYNNANFKCHQCGSVGHKPGECRAISVKCNNCQKIGHLARMCRSKTVPRKPYGSQARRKVECIKESARYSVKIQRKVRSHIAKVSQGRSMFYSWKDTTIVHKSQLINGQKTKMVADTGCRQNIISSQLYREQFRRFPLERTTKQFVAYEQKIPLTCLGRFKAKLKAGITIINSYVYVIEGEAESLLERKSCFDLEILKPVKPVKQVELNCGKVRDTRL